MSVEPRRESSARPSVVSGLVLIAVGILFLVQQLVGFDLGHYGWPLFIIVPGLALLAGYAVGGRGAASLAVPGCVVTTVGLILLIQNTFNLWQTWAYAWALVTASVGLGLMLQAQRLEQPRVWRSGVGLLEGGVVGFLVFGAFFEFVIDLSHFGGSTYRSVIGPLILIAIGAYLLLRRREHFV